MKNERMLAYKMSQKLTTEELEGVSAAGTSVVTGHVTYGQQGGVDGNGDVSIDM